jgi:hypothetical protein
LVRTRFCGAAWNTAIPFSSRKAKGIQQMANRKSWVSPEDLQNCPCGHVGLNRDSGEWEIVMRR